MSSADDRGDESHKERVDREMLELLNELRVAIPGVQVLFAFLLTVPFAQRFGEASEFQRDMYYVTLIAAAIASGLLIAPAAQHRVLFRQRNKEQLLRRSNRYAFAGVVMLAVAITAAIVLVADFMFGRGQAYVTGAVILALLSWWWVASPLMHRVRTVQEDS
jgi:hypothetical protein